MSKKKILLIVAVLFMCLLSLVATVGAALLFRQNQLNMGEITNLQKQVEDLKQQKESDAKDNEGNSSSDVIPPTPGGMGDTGSGTELSKIHFSKIPQSDDDFTFTVSANREISTLEPVESSINQIIVGPTAAEAADGVRNPIILTGSSNCGGSDFTTSTTYDYTTRETDTKVQFCKDLPSGIGPIAKIKTVITKTLEDLEDSVAFHLGSLAILDKNGNCLGDESGLNLCLE